MRKFESGATRDDDDTKLDYEAFLSPLVLERYAEFLHKNRVQADGGLRSGDNWQRGMSLPVYMKSLARHFMEAWMCHRGHRRGIEDALCGVLFNTMGYLFEVLKTKSALRDQEVQK